MYLLLCVIHSMRKQRGLILIRKKILQNKKFSEELRGKEKGDGGGGEGVRLIYYN